MCTLIVIHRSVTGAPLVVAANRDEYFDRPAEGPALRENAGGPVVAPIDLRAGGTWLGLNRAGVFAAVTNRRSPKPDPARRSRGLVVMDALARSSAEEAADMLTSLPAHFHNPFNALVADAHRAFTLVYQDAPVVEELSPGAHVIGNADPDSEQIPKLRRLMKRARRVAKLPAGRVLGELASICREHRAGESPLDDTCVHLDAYGTRSSTLLQLGDEKRLLFAEGAPCSNEYQDFTSLLHELSRTASYGAGEKESRMAS